jgi:hypothetical protein
MQMEQTLRRLSNRSPIYSLMVRPIDSVFSHWLPQLGKLDGFVSFGCWEMKPKGRSTVRNSPRPRRGSLVKEIIHGHNRSEA